MEKILKWSLLKSIYRHLNKHKKTLTIPSILAHYDTKLSLKLSCDVHVYSSGSMLSIVTISTIDGAECSIAYASQALFKAEHNYSWSEKEELS